jgi:peptide/nickel transport system substrate-binding protein
MMQSKKRKEAVMNKRLTAGSILLISFLLIIGTSLVSIASEGPQYGGTLHCALASEPGTLDMQMDTGVAASIPARHILEGLFAFDASYTPQPMLALSWELDSTGTVATFNLRRGVLFHDGTELKAEDVIASLNRWGEYGLTAAALWSHVTDLVALDDYTVQLTLDEPFAPMTTYLANIYGGPSIYPKEIAENAGAQPIAAKDIVGTGPYTFVEWKAGDYILLERFAGYSSSPAAASGFAGEKVAYLDKLQFFFVPEDNARLVGVQAGTYDYAVNIPNDLLVNVEGDPSIFPIITDHPPIYPIALVNNRAGLMTNSALKRAIITALDMEAIMLAGYGDPTFWSLNPSYFAPGIRWHTENEGGGLYNANDPAKARQMAESAGYNNETIRIIVAQDMTSQYNQALVVTDQLQKAGFKVDLQVYDKATFFSVRNSKDDPDNPPWEIAFSFYSTTPDPSLVLMLNPNYAGWWDTPEIQKLRNELNKITDFDERYAKWEEIMDLWYEQIPALKFGDAYQLHLMQTEIGGGYGTPETPPMLSPYFWNAWRK